MAGEGRESGGAGGSDERVRNHLTLVSRWADDLAHEIKNPFHAMVINLELVKRRAGDPERLRERAEVVESELHRVHGLIDGVLKLVRPWPAHDRADADAVVRALAPVIEARAGLRHIDYRHEPGAGTVAMPPGDLALVILNLVDNAMDALGEGGSLRVRGGEEGGAGRIEVEDDGPGLGISGDPFDAGVSTRPDRDGLGLAVCRRLVESAGGRIVAGPRAGEGGTTIALTLPRPGAA